MYVKSEQYLPIKYLPELFPFSSAMAWDFVEVWKGLNLIWISFRQNPTAHKMTQFANKQIENSWCLLGKLSNGA